MLCVGHIWLYLIISNGSGDNEKNSGLKPNSYQGFSICHWNLNSISAHNFLKLSLLQACITLPKFDVIGLSEIHLNLFTLNDDNHLHIIPGYNLYREYHPLNLKQGVFTTTFLFHLKLKISIT